MTTSDLTPFARHYLICALWSSMESYEDDVPLDENYGLSDIAPETLQQAQDDCNAFSDEITAILAAHGDCVAWDSERFGHDFWLSRNGHGAGFFDRGNEPVWDALQAAAKVWGTVDLYVGDDGLIHS
jgi:hypothetical protein